MAELTVVAKGKAKSGCEPALEAALREVVEPTRREPGCLQYILHRVADDPSTFVMIERWASKPDLDRHFTTPHIQKLFQKLSSLVVAPPEILVLESEF